MTATLTATGRFLEVAHRNIGVIEHMIKRTVTLVPGRGDGDSFHWGRRRLTDTQKVELQAALGNANRKLENPVFLAKASPKVIAGVRAQKQVCEMELSRIEEN